jgi:SP family sugar:H+ symporter-like MFS transporter
MPQFLSHYGSLDPATGKYGLSAKEESLVTSIINAGEFFGAIASTFIADKVGRKGGPYVSSTCVVIGIILQVDTIHEGSLITGRLVLGKGSLLPKFTVQGF